MHKRNKIKENYFNKFLRIVSNFVDVDLTEIKILGLSIKNKKEEVHQYEKMCSQTGLILTGDRDERAYKLANLNFGQHGTCDCCGKTLLPYDDKYLCEKCEDSSFGNANSTDCLFHKNNKEKLDKVWFVLQNGD